MVFAAIKQSKTLSMSTSYSVDAYGNSNSLNGGGDTVAAEFASMLAAMQTTTTTTATILPTIM